MKLLCRLVSLGLFAAWTAVAGASPLDFKANVLDPTPPFGGTPYPLFDIDLTSFVVTFSACVANELPNGLTADGCFAGVNKTGLDWTSLQFQFANDAVLHSQPVDCTPAPSDNIFLTSSCGFNSREYTLTFFNGVLKDNEFFFVTETGVSPDLFPHGEGTVLTSTAATPEPASFFLLATGLGVGLVLWKLQR